MIALLLKHPLMLPVDAKGKQVTSWGDIEEGWALISGKLVLDLPLDLF